MARSMITAVAGGLMLASQPLANAATQPAATRTPASIVKTAPPAVPAPVAGGTLDSLVGIGNGAITGATPVLGLPRSRDLQHLEPTGTTQTKPV
jgi:hypothetical protein